MELRSQMLADAILHVLSIDSFLIENSLQRFYLSLLCIATVHKHSFQVLEKPDKLTLFEIEILHKSVEQK